jgi:rhodanese-related sulfurtransferase/glyoxylase-like metal-dependent hydrolase (beta-lactamase superfamily II)
VSGHLDLAKATGAVIVYGPGAKPGFDARITRDGETLQLGSISVQVLHTPGHTMESVCYLVRDEQGREHALITGDTLFIGDVGRPDLAQQAADLSQEQLAGLLYDSLRNKIFPLGDEVLVYPAHGAGSACGKNMSKETVSTIGYQKVNNYALRPDMTREEFIRELLDGLQPPPAYFPLNVKMNRDGYESFDRVLTRGTRPLNVAQFEEAANHTGALILDTRKPEQFTEGFIPSSVNIGIDGSFAPWVGALVSDLLQPILLVTEPGREEEVVTRLARVGYDNAIGYLDGGFAAWQASGREVDSITTIGAREFVSLYLKQPQVVADVRKPAEFADGHLAGALNLPLDYINENMHELPKDQPVYVHCAGGYRSVIASSILKARGWDNLVNVAGGFADISKTEVPVVQESNLTARTADNH